MKTWTISPEKEVERRKKIKQNNAKYWLGKKRPDMAGRPSHMLGRKHSDETKLKMSESHSGINNASWKGGMPSCLTCNKQLSRRMAKYCREHAGATRCGVKNSNWKNGITTESDKLRTIFLRTVQPLVLERDNYTCKVCCKKATYLHVDHIKKWSEYPDLRFDDNNCRTVCRSCHYYITFNKIMPANSKWGIK